MLNTMPRYHRKCMSFSTCFRLVFLILLVQLFIYLLNYYGPDNYGNEDFPDANLKPTSGSWQIVDGKEADTFLVYSAFLDIRQTNIVRAIAVAATSRRKRPYVWCKYWYKNRTHHYENKTVPGKLQIIKEHWNLKYSPFYVLCPVNPDDPIADLVSVLSAPEQIPRNFLKIIVNYDYKNKWNPTQQTVSLDKIALCVKPLHYDYNKVMELLEFIELHRIMGVDHFFLYNHTTGPQVGCLLKKYQKERIVTVLEWQLPIVSQKEIRTEGIFAAINDCLYRTMHKYSFTVFVDFDEIIVPTYNYSYRRLLKFLDKDGKYWSTFLFRNAFFYMQWPDDSEVEKFKDPIAKNLIVLKKTTRRKDFHRYRTRSKYIVRPELINMAGNHFIWEYYNIKKFTTLNVKPEDAFLHHYRTCEFGGDDCVKHNSTVDKTAYRYKNELIQAVRARYNQFFSDCKLSDVRDLNEPT